MTVAEMRALERATFAAGVSEARLMDQAGSAVADALAAWLPRTERRTLLALVGKGNNGGDALIAARRLHERCGMTVRLYLLSDRAADPLLEWAEAGGAERAVHSPRSGARLRAWLEEADVVLDGVLGIGARLPLGGALASVLETVDRHRPTGQRRVAVDVPTGVDADTGRADARAFRADLTLVTGPAKPGLLIHPGAAHAGRVVPLDIGLRADASGDRLARLDDAQVASLLPARRDDSHKGTYGKLLVVAGSARYTGAAYLTSAAAVRAGAGLVTLAAPRDVKEAVAGQSPETTFLPLADDPAAPGALTPGHLGTLLDAAAGYDAVVMGPGQGAAPQTRELVALMTERLAMLDPAPRLLIDADGLNALAARGEWARPQGGPWVLTPHPGEMARLSGLQADAVQRDRLGLAAAKAAEWGQVVVLKGAPSIVAAPGGAVRLTPFANASLAVAGTGDVLSGTIGALLAQGVEPFAAAAAGSYVHGLAGELWRAAHGSAGLPATGLLELLPSALDRLRRR
ncbi:MAG TPA: NAD(P)H-hydrate dehydratase [Chloroflexota bacterium]|nr:NAD(P)H-hydrate dehydratase [Chloroflexota bacterium]